MKTLIIWLALAVVGILGHTTLAQSGRSQGGTDGKANQRRPEPTPSPAARPANDVNTALDDGEIIKVNTQLVSVPVRVMDKKGRFIAGLARENFKVFEDGIEQELSLFSNENEPFTVALVLDMSYSTTFKIAEIQNAAVEFIDQLRPQDKVVVVSFDEDVHLLCAPTNDRKEIYRAVRSTKIATGTSLYEAIDLVINNQMRQVNGRKAIILFTDGVDTTSRRSNDMSNLHDAMELDSLIYTIRYDTFNDVQQMKNGSGNTKPPPITVPIPISSGNPLPFPMPTMGSPSSQGTTVEEYKKATEYLEQLALRTGGRTYDTTSLVNLADAYHKIASELREFYSIGYYPKSDRVAGKNVSIKVKVDQPGLVVRSRETFIHRRSTK